MNDSFIHRFIAFPPQVCGSLVHDVRAGVCLLVTHLCAELSELVKMHGTHDNEDPLSFDEVLIVKVSLRTQLLGDLSSVPV